MVTLLSMSSIASVLSIAVTVLNIAVTAEYFDGCDCAKYCGCCGIVVNMLSIVVLNKPTKL